jgi:H+/Cl- antiporter ClcA
MTPPSDDELDARIADYRDLHRDYTYRRRLTGRELVPAIGVGVAVGLLGYYVARILAQRTPLAPEARRPAQRPRPIVRQTDG